MKDPNINELGLSDQSTALSWGRDLVILVLASFMLPLAGVLVSPVLRAFLVFRSGRVYALVGLLWLLLVISPFRGLWMLAPFAALYWALLIFRVFELKVRKHPYQLMFATAVIIQVSLEIWSYWRLGHSFTAGLVESLTDMGWKNISNWIHDLTPWLMHVARGLMLLSTLVFLGFSLTLDVKFAWGLGWLLKKNRSPVVLRYPQFSRFGLADYWIWVVIASLAGLLWAPTTWKGWFLETLIVGLGLFGIQGLAVVEFFLNEWRAGLWVRAIVYVLLLSHLVWTLLLVGLSDFWFDWRTRWKRRTKEELS